MYYKYNLSKVKICHTYNSTMDVHEVVVYTLVSGTVLDKSEPPLLKQMVLFYADLFHLEILCVVKTLTVCKHKH